MNRTAAQLEQAPSLSDDLLEILSGLSQEKKSISPKYFYDDMGSRLFDEICELPEYYLTRAELEIMRIHVAEIARLIGPQASLIEYGSGSSLKTRVLLGHLDDLAAYVPVDISREHLLLATARVNKEFPRIEVLPVVADFTQPFKLPMPKIMPRRNIVYFPGSTIGNFSAEAARELMSIMHQEAGEDGAMLIGVDLQKDVAILEQAYNDAQCVTAAFNRNILQRLNNEFDGTFRLEQFQHRATYNADDGRIEMYLDSLVDQTAWVGGEKFHFRENEAVLTEHSHKYSLEGFAAMAEASGFCVEKVWTDPETLFSVQYCLRV